MAQADDNKSPTQSRDDYRTFTQLRQDLRDELIRLMTAENKATAEKVKGVTADAAEAKKIALSARKISMQPHSCSQVATLAELRESVGSWAKWWRGIMVTLIAAIIVFGATIGGWWYSHMGVKAEVKTLNVEVVKVQTEVKATNASFEDFRVSFEKKERVSKQEQQQQVQDIAKAVGQAVQKELKNSRRR